jgi:hypothetical protein
MTDVNTFISPEVVSERELSTSDITISFTVVFICKVTRKIKVRYNNFYFFLERKKKSDTIMILL